MRLPALVIGLLSCLTQQNEIQMRLTECECSGCQNSIECSASVEITNLSSERLYTWIDYDYDASSTESSNIKRFLLTHHGDFNMITLLTDNVVFLDYTPIIGKTFVTIIEPNESFIFTGVEDDTILDYIIVIKESQFRRIIGFSLSDNWINSGVIFEGNSFDLKSSNALSN